MLPNISKTTKGLFNLVGHNGFIYAADSITVTPEGLKLTLNNLECGIVNADELQKVFKIENRSTRIEDISVLQLVTTFNAVDAAIKELQRTKAATKPEIIIFGATSLALTILPTRVSEDIDLITSEDLVEIFADNQFSNTPIEVLDSNITQDLGDWRSRTCKLSGAGANYNIMHPLDTLSQKLLRSNETIFLEKDMPDIREIVKYFNPSIETIETILKENPTRFISQHFGDRLDKETSIQNTNTFLTECYPEIDFNNLLKSIFENREFSGAQPSTPQIPPLQAIDMQDIAEQTEIEL